jgi:hypothetical protein
VRGSELVARRWALRHDHSDRQNRSAGLVFVLRRRSGLVEGVGLRDIRRDRGLFFVVRLEFLCLLERVRLGNGLGFLGQTTSFVVAGPSFVGHGHSLAALQSRGPSLDVREYRELEAGEREPDPETWDRICGEE